MKRYGAAFVGGVFLLLCAILARVSWDQNPQSTSGTLYWGEFQNIEGIAPGTPVLFAGFPVGKTGTPQLNPENFTIRLPVMIDSSLELPADSTLELSQYDLFAPPVIVIKGGGAEELLEQGELFADTTNAVDILHLVKRVLDSVSNTRLQSEKN